MPIFFAHLLQRRLHRDGCLNLWINPSFVNRIEAESFSSQTTKNDLQISLIPVSQRPSFIVTKLALLAEATAERVQGMSRVFAGSKAIWVNPSRILAIEEYLDGTKLHFLPQDDAAVSLAGGVIVAGVIDDQQVADSRPQALAETSRY